MVIALTAVGVLLDIIGLAIPYWRAGEIGNVDYNFGLWSVCQDPPGECETFRWIDVGKCVSEQLNTYSRS